nr:MAG TPA: hypothetical protein [Caudoviricetes sp.]
MFKTHQSTSINTVIPVIYRLSVHFLTFPRPYPYGFKILLLCKQITYIL